MLKALLPVIMFCAFISALLLLTPAHSSSLGWSITVQTDRSYYRIGDAVHISGKLTYNDWQKQNVTVSIIVKPSSSSTPHYLATPTTDTDGKYNSSFTFGISAELAAYTVFVNAEGTTNQSTFKLTDAIYIKANGDIEPTNAPISKDGDTYTLTGNITANSTDGIIIERNNTILDGAGFTLNGKNLIDSNGINLNSISNITVKGMSINSFQNGIDVRDCFNCQIMETNLSLNGNGVFFQYSDFNTIEGNNITRNAYAGIWLDLSQNNTISRNRLANNTIASNLVGGINLQDFSSYNSIVENDFINNTWYGVYIQNSFSNSIFHNNLYNSTHLAYVDGNTLGNVWDNGYPSGGNYWSDYSGYDQKQGPNQDQSGSDGIGDTPYIIDINNMDHFPLMSSYPIGSAPSYPTASFTHYPDFPIAKQELVIFNGSASQCTDGTLTNYCWNFGDGTYGEYAVTNHTYESYGNYAVTLMVISNTRSSSNQSKPVSVRENPTASFTIQPINPSAGQPIIFDASTSMPIGGTITTYTWDFGDGNLTSAGDPVTAHTYAFPGIFNATLTVVDSEDLDSSLSQTVSVKIPTLLSISTNPSSTYSGFKVNVNGTLQDIYRNDLDNETILLYYSFPETATWFPIGPGLTDSVGCYTVQWAPSSGGYFTIKAEWAGNATHYGASSNLTLSVLGYQNQQVLSVESNSTVSALAFNTTSSELSFNVTGPSGTTCYAKITVAKNFVENITNTKVYLDSNQVGYSLDSTEDSWILTFTYTHSTHKVTIDLQADLTSPITTEDYDGSWHNVDFTVYLNATDQESGVLETYYRINDDPTLNVTANGQPLITVESANNTLEYWSVDKAGNEEAHHVLTDIKLDKTKPTGSILIDNGGAYTNSTSATLNLSASDNVSGVAKMRFSNDDVSWTSWEAYNASKVWTLGSDDGLKVVYFQIKDNAGLESSINAATILLDASSPSITTPLRIPTSEIQPNLPVRILVNVTDFGSGIESVELAYFTNKSAIGLILPMMFNQTSGLYESTMSGQEAGTLVLYQITAVDHAGNSVTNDNAGQYYVYAVIPEFPNTSIILLFMIATLLTTIVCRRKHTGRLKWVARSSSRGFQAIFSPLASFGSVHAVCGLLQRP